VSQFLRSAVAALSGRLGSRGRANGVGLITTENNLAGSKSWRIGADGSRAADDIRMQIKGYASATSVNVGESIDFHVTVEPNQDFTVAIYRLGYYDGQDARHLTTSPTLRGVTRTEPDLDPTTGMISCGWPSAWSLKIRRNWVSGLHLAVFTTTTGWRSFTPFVVRNDARSGGLCVLLPFSTYQAYNQWPLDGQRGKSLYYGYARPENRDVPAEAVGSASAKLEFLERAYKVSFDRPYSRDGLPNRFDYDRDFIRWVEQSGYDVTYADSLDLHSGLIDPTRHVGLIFCGHDEYWSYEMREAVTKALAQGTSLAFMTANNLYWHVRLEPSADGRDNRVVVCYKKATDPAPDASGTTAQWRVPPPGPGDAEQRLLGVQYNGIVPAPVPLVVKAADHWFWAGCDVKTSDKIDRVVGGEADGLDPRFPVPTDVTQTLLSASPYQLKDGTRLVQNTSLYETQDGAIVFVAGSLDWPAALSRNGLQEPRIRTATTNLLDRMTGPRLHPTGQKESTDAMSQTQEQPTDPQKSTSKPVSLPSQDPSVYEVLYTKGGFGYDANVDTWRTWVEKHYVAEFDLKPGMRLLDVGCGDGFWAMLLAEQGMEVAGVDRAVAAIEVAQSRLPEAEFVCSDIINPLPFEPESFDVAFMRGLSVFGVPEIADDASDRQLANVARMVRPGGILLASTYTNLSGGPSEGSTWINYPVSTIVAAIEKVADPFKVIRAGNYLQVGARRRDDI
jgi:SAM-dependent methyltransferase